MEGRGLSNWRTSRHCVITRLNDLTPDLFYTIKNKAGALIVMLPKDMTNLTIDEQQVNNLVNNYKKINRH